jgi:hypothetical protein
LIPSPFQKDRPRRRPAKPNETRSKSNDDRTAKRGRKTK